MISKNFNDKEIDNDYEIVNILEEGIIQKIILSKNKKSQNHILIKLIDLKKLDKDGITMMSEEGKLVSELAHPNITNFISFKIINDRAYIIMDYIDGVTLQNKINEFKKEKKNFSEMDILNYIIEISEGIKFINDTGIVHRLLKPKKIFLTKDNHIKLSDFGFASILEEQYKSDKIDKENIIYYSPELLNEEISDFTSDAWNIGIILYELTQLKHPFDDNNIDKIMENISNGKYHSLTNNNYSNDLLQLIENLLIVNPEERYEIMDIINECELIKLKNILGPNSK